MVDTIVIILNKTMFQINSPDKFEPSARWLLSEKPVIKKGLKSKQYPLKKDLLQGIYKPRLTLFQSYNSNIKPEIMLKIELSLPKLLFGNNFEELQYKDFQNIVKKLVHTLNKMGIATTFEAIAESPVSSIHYSKNIILTDGSIPYHYINKIKEANIKLSLDINQTDYRNEGHSYKWHCNSYEVAFYDKIQDLEQAIKSSKRTIEQDNELQLNLFDTFKDRKMYEVLRVEVRLNKRQKINMLFKSLNIKSDLTFSKLFKPSISKKILLHYINEIESKRKILLDYKPNSSKSLLVDLVLNNPDLGPQKIMQIFGLKYALEIMPSRELRTIFSKYNQRSWYRLMSFTNEIKLPINQRSLQIIKDQLIKFKPLTFKKRSN